MTKGLGRLERIAAELDPLPGLLRSEILLSLEPEITSALEQFGKFPALPAPNPIDRAGEQAHNVKVIKNDPRLLEACLKIATIMEGIGYSVYARIVPLSVAADLIGGTARIAWQNFRPFVELERARAGTQKSWEWFQWLVEQLERHSVTKTNLKMGAQTVYGDWQP